MGNQHQKKSDYEKMWKEAFDHATMPPSADLWDKIDTQLTRQESGTYKRRFLFYRAVAAACLICLLGLGVFTVSHYHEDKSQEHLSISHQPSVSQPSSLKPEAAPPQINDHGEYAANSHEQNSSIKDKKDKGVHEPLYQETKQTNNAYSSQHGPQVASALPRATAAGWHTIPATLSLPARNGPLYRVPNPYAVKTQKTEKDGPVFFAGLDLSGNYFDPNFQPSPMRAGADMAPASLMYDGLYSFSPERSMYASSERAPGTENTPRASFSYGMEVGVHLTRRLSVQSGIDYGRFNTSTMTNRGIKSLSSREQYPFTISNAGSMSADQGVMYITNTSLTSSFELLTIPLKIGYHIIFNKLQLFLSSGMAANFFLNNRISDESGQLHTVNVQAGSESIYREVFYSGVISGGASYNITGNYLIKIAPEYSFSVSEMTQEGSFISSQPFLFGMNFGIIYKFK